MTGSDLVTACVFLIDGHCSAVDTVRTTGLGQTAHGEQTSRALVDVVLSLVRMAFPPLPGTLTEMIVLWPQPMSADL